MLLTLILSLFMVGFIITTTSASVYDGGFHRYNRLQRSDLLSKVDSFTLSAINSLHFMRNVDVDSHAQQVAMATMAANHPTWEELMTSLDLLQTTLTSQQSTSQLLTTQQQQEEDTPQKKHQPFIPTSIPPSQSKPLEQLAQKIGLESNWGRSDWSLDSHFTTPQGKIRQNLSEDLPWDHPKESQMVLVVDGQEILMILEAETNFGANYNPKVQSYDRYGKLISSSPPSSKHTTSCYYNAKIAGIIQPGVGIHMQSTTPQEQKIMVQSNQHHNFSTSSMTNTPTNNTSVQFSTPSVNMINSPFHQTALNNGGVDQLDIDFPEYGVWFPFNTCRGGFSGSFHLKGKLYQVEPLVNHISVTELASIMNQLEQNARAKSDPVPDINSIHIVFDTNQPSYDYLTQHLDELKSQGIDVQSLDNHKIFCSSSANDDHDHDHNHDHESLLALLQSTTRLVMDNNDNSNNTSTPIFEELQSTKYVEFFLVSDFKRTTTLGVDQAIAHTTSLWQRVRSYYNYHNNGVSSQSFSQRVEVVLVDQFVWKDRDPYPVLTPGSCSACSPTEIDVDTLLSNWNSWRSSGSTNGVPHHDNGHLLSGYDFQSSVLGYAGVGTMCMPQASGGINQVQRSDNTDFFAIVVSHELGHNFSMNHDSSNNDCPTGQNIMSPSLSPTQTSAPYNQFSQCSLSSANQRLASYSCLNNVPEYTYGQPRCGNGIIEGDEMCDCGVDCSNDPCCNGATCQLYETAIVNGISVTPQCSPLQGCCDEQCQVRSSEFVCSPATSDCDLPETCDGISGSCPLNLVKGDAFECTSTESNFAMGRCYRGSCTTEQGACNALSSDLTACPSETYTIQPDDDKYCSNMQCSTGQSCVVVGRGSDSTTPTPLPWDNGVPCGAKGSGKQCSEGKCIDMNTEAVRYQWVFSDFEKCEVCGSPQLRTAECKDLQTGTFPPNVQQCTFPAAVKSSLVRPCNEIQLGCVYDYSEEEKAKHKGKTYLFGLWLSTIVIVVIFIGILLIWAIIGLFCYRCLTRPVDGKKDMSDDQENPDENKKKDKKKKKKNNNRDVEPTITTTTTTTMIIASPPTPSAPAPQPDPVPQPDPYQNHPSSHTSNELYHDNYNNPYDDNPSHPIYPM